MTSTLHYNVGYSNSFFFFTFVAAPTQNFVFPETSLRMHSDSTLQFIIINGDANGDQLVLNWALNDNLSPTDIDDLMNKIVALKA